MRSLTPLLDGARQRLLAAGVSPEEARLDAELLARHVLGWDRARLIVSRDEPVPDSSAETFEALVRRRAAREPTAYILGHKEFWGLDFLVSPGVLIPRPETELIIEETRRLLERASRPLVADVGTGSGCLAVALAVDCPTARVIATDTSRTALDVAHRNAVHHKVADRCRFVRSSMLDALAGPFDVVMSNPPYVPTVDAPQLQPEVRDFEPASALFAGPDGLDAIRALVTNAPSTLRPGGALIFELGQGQADAVADVVRHRAGLELRCFRSDLQGIPRTAVVVRC